VFVTLAVVLHILASLVAAKGVSDVRDERKKVVGMSRSRWAVRGVTAFALVTADLLVNIAVIAGSG
jgi:hypothetical protein